MSSVASPEQAERFVEKWRASSFPSAASHEHFIDLCKLVGQPTPAEADPTGENYCFEKPVKVTLSASKGSKGEGGFVDVWKRGCFAWEYKRKDKYKNLDEAYRQLYQYRDDSGQPAALGRLRHQHDRDSLPLRRLSQPTKRSSNSKKSPASWKSSAASSPIPRPSAPPRPAKSSRPIWPTTSPIWPTA